MAKPEKREKARRLRKQGQRISEIAKELDVHPATVSGWCRDIKLTDQQIAENAIDDPGWAAALDVGQRKKNTALKRRLGYQEAGRERAKDRNTLHLMGAMLYWGEGAKRRSAMRFGNTDPNMLRLFIKFIRAEFNVPNDKIRLSIQTHSKDKKEWERIRKYWLDILELPEECKVTVRLKIGTDSRKNRHSNGFCCVNVYSTEIVQQIFGAIQEYAQCDKPQWVE